MTRLLRASFWLAFLVLTVNARWLLPTWWLVGAIAFGLWRMHAALNRRCA